MQGAGCRVQGSGFRALLLTVTCFFTSRHLPVAAFGEEAGDVAFLDVGPRAHELLLPLRHRHRRIADDLRAASLTVTLPTVTYRHRRVADDLRAASLSVTLPTVTYRHRRIADDLRVWHQYVTNM